MCALGWFASSSVQFCSFVVFQFVLKFSEQLGSCLLRCALGYHWVAFLFFFSSRSGCNPTTQLAMVPDLHCSISVPVELTSTLTTLLQGLSKDQWGRDHRKYIGDQQGFPAALAFGLTTSKVCTVMLNVNCRACGQG